MKRLALSLGALAAGLAISLFAGQAQAAPCVTVTSGESVPVADLIAGECVNAGDKIFSNFSDTGFSNTGSASWVFANDHSNVTLGFLGALGPSATGDLTYQVAINPALAGNLLIHDVEKDFTLNAVDGTGLATGTLSAVITPAVGSVISFSCSRQDNPEVSSCPQTRDLSELTSSITIAETLAVGTNSVATALTDTISQAAAPEPTTLGLLGTGLLGLGFVARRRRR